VGPSAGLDALEKKKISFPCWYSNLWSSTPWATPQTDYTFSVPLNVSGSCAKAGFAKPVLNVWLMLPECYLKVSHPSVSSSELSVTASTLTLVSKRSTQHDQDVRKNSEKKKTHSMPFDVQTRLFKLVCC